MTLLKQRCSVFLEIPLSLPSLLLTLISSIKVRPPSNASAKLVQLPFDFFADASENLVMADDVATPLNPPVAP